MAKNTFEKYKKNLHEFVNGIILSNPDYIVPVEKKGCKLLRSLQLDDNILHEKVRYRQFFLNNNICLSNKKIAIFDDASKYTSTLWKYRKFFEKLGAEVDTYSYVGQKKLFTGEREQYDPQAKIFMYLDESAYQEYIIQQSQTLSANDNFFDIDHLVATITEVSKSEYYKIVNYLNNKGDIVYTNDVYTVDYVEKLSLYNHQYQTAEGIFPDGICQGAFQKIRFAYNFRKHILTVAPISFPAWNSNETKKNNIFEQVPFEMPFLQNEFIGNDGIFFNICYVFHLYILKQLLRDIFTWIGTHKYKVRLDDLIAYIGYQRAAVVKESAIQYINSNTMPIVRKDIRSRIVIQHQKDSIFFTVKDIMSELRREYEKRVDKAGTLLGVKYFLSYEEIIDRYRGKANLMKWIDILCDRGVLVARSCCFNGIYYRACRSGEGDSDHIEKKTGILLPVAINACGTANKIKIKRNKVSNSVNTEYYSISPTYLNKILSNMVYDYPREEYDFHSLFSKPDNYGPLCRIGCELEEETSLALYDVEKITDLCWYNNNTRKFESVSSNVFFEKMQDQMGLDDAVPSSELLAYFTFLKELRNAKGNMGFLNAVAICRDEHTYYRYLHHNLSSAKKYLLHALTQPSQEVQISFLQEAGRHINSTKTKLKYNQKEIKEFILEFHTPLIYAAAKNKIISSFTDFSKEFTEKRLPIINTITQLEYIVVNLFLFTNTFNSKYWGIFTKNYNKIGKQSDHYKEIEELVKHKDKWNDEQYYEYLSVFREIATSLMGQVKELFEKLPPPIQSANYNMEVKRNTNIATNKAINFISHKSLKHFVILHYGFSGYRNLNDSKEINVLQTVQKHVAKFFSAETNSKIIFGETGKNEQGTIIFDTLEAAKKFSENLSEFFRTNPILNQIKFRFGCSYREFNSDNSLDINRIVQDAICDAIECEHFSESNQTKSLFIISSRTKEEFDKSNYEIGDKIIMNDNNNNYYEYGQAIYYENIIKYTEKTDNSVRIGIITVLPEEFKSMKKMIGDTKTGIFPGKGSGHQFEIGYISALGGGRHKIALAQTLGDNNNKAAFRAARLIEHFPKLEVILMVGIAAGTPVIMDDYPENDLAIIEKHIRLGDVVVSDGIIQYDYVKDKGFEESLKGEHNRPSALLLEAHQRLMNSDSCIWNRYIDEAIKTLSHDYERPDESYDKLFDKNGKQLIHPIDRNRKNYPYIFKGKIAAANRLLRNADKRDELKNKHNVLAIEMESAGIADVTWEAEIGYFVVRGISDYGDRHKNDIWHNYSALAAAAYAKALIENIPTYD